MKNKKWYIIVAVLVLVVGSILLVVTKKGTDSMDGTYYWYSSYDDVGEYSKKEFIVIKGDSLTYTSDKDSDYSTSWKLDKKNKTVSYKKAAEYPYSYDKDIFSFNGVNFVKEGSDTFKNAKE